MAEVAQVVVGEEVVVEVGVANVAGVIEPGVVTVDDLGIGLPLLPVLGLLEGLEEGGLGLGDLGGVLDGLGGLALEHGGLQVEDGRLQVGHDGVLQPGVGGPESQAVGDVAHGLELAVGIDILVGALDPGEGVAELVLGGVDVGVAVVVVAELVLQSPDVMITMSLSEDPDRESTISYAYLSGKLVRGEARESVGRGVDGRGGGDGNDGGLVLGLGGGLHGDGGGGQALGGVGDGGEAGGGVVGEAVGVGIEAAGVSPVVSGVDQDGLGLLLLGSMAHCQDGGNNQL